MKLIIDMPEDLIECIKSNPNYYPIYHFEKMWRAIANGTPLDKIRAEIGKSKTEHEMQIAERDIKAKLLICDIYCDIVNILDKYKAESEADT